MALSRPTRTSAARERAPLKPRFAQFRGQRMVRRWRHRMAPDPLTRKPKGAVPFWARARRLFWSWWVWALLYLWATVAREWNWAAGCGAMALLSYLITPSEFPPRYG